MSFADVKTTIEGLKKAYSFDNTTLDEKIRLNQTMEYLEKMDEVLKGEPLKVYSEKFQKGCHDLSFLLLPESEKKLSYDVINNCIELLMRDIRGDIINDMIESLNAVNVEVINNISIASMYAKKTYMGICVLCKAAAIGANVEEKKLILEISKNCLDAYLSLQ